MTTAAGDLTDFVRRHAAAVTPALVPELRLHLTDDVVTLWERMTDLAPDGEQPELPYWAYAWPGGLAVARYVLDHPDLVRGKRVLDVAAGSGLLAVAARLSGAARAVANDIDPLSLAAAHANAALNGVEIVTIVEDLLDTDTDDDVVLVGDAFYTRGLAERMLPFLQRAVRRGALVLVGDPGRDYLPPRTVGLRRVATYLIPVTELVEAGEIKRTGVFRLSERRMPLRRRSG